MASTQRAYLNSEEYESEKSPSLFTLAAQVRASTLAERHRNLIVAMLLKNRFGTELWMSTASISVAMGRACCRRKKTGWSTHEKPHRLGNCKESSRRRVQRLIDDLVYCGACGKSTNRHPADHAFIPRVEGGGVLDEVYEANSHVSYGGKKEFRHTATYRLNPDKLVPARTYEEYAAERDRERAASRQKHREQAAREEAETKTEVQAQAEVTPIRKSPAPASDAVPAAPVPQRQKPAAEHHRSNSAPPRPRFAMLTRREVPKFITVFDNLMQPKKIAEREIFGPRPLAPQGSPPSRDNSWTRILDTIAPKTNRHSFETWLSPTRYSREENGVLYVSVPTAEFRPAGDKFADLIREAIKTLGLNVEDVRFVIPEQHSPPKFEKMSREQALEKACQLYGISREHGEEILRLHGRNAENPKT